jgi:hypothetical protein
MPETGRHARDYAGSLVQRICSREQEAKRNENQRDHDQLQEKQGKNARVTHVEQHLQPRQHAPNPVVLVSLRGGLKLNRVASEGGKSKQQSEELGQDARHQAR